MPIDAKSHLKSGNWKKKQHEKVHLLLLRLKTSTYWPKDSMIHTSLSLSVDYLVLHGLVAIYNSSLELGCKFVHRSTLAAMANSHFALLYCEEYPLVNP